jgi:hypothetical protein
MHATFCFVSHARCVKDAHLAQNTTEHMRMNGGLLSAYTDAEID